MNHTQSIALASGSIILPLRHPAHTAKSLQSLQALSKGRVILGIASGDRAIEYPAFGRDINLRGEIFRDHFFYLKSLLDDFPIHESTYYGSTNGSIDLLPKPPVQTSFLVTGHSGQSLDWIAVHSDGWLYYPRDFKTLQYSMSNWKSALAKNKQGWKPYMQSLYIDLIEDAEAKPTPIHLGIKTGIKYLLAHLKLLETHGVNHIIINLKYSSRPATIVLDELATHILPHFH